MRRLILAAAALLAVSACAQPGARPVATPNEPTTAAPAKVKITAQQLLGAAQPWVLANLGAPDFKRADMHANLWQYKNAACMLNVFLYVDDRAKTAPAQVLHFDARDALGFDTDRDACLSSLQDKGTLQD